MWTKLYASWIGTYVRRNTLLVYYPTDVWVYYRKHYGMRGSSPVPASLITSVDSIAPDPHWNTACHSGVKLSFASSADLFLLCVSSRAKSNVPRSWPDRKRSRFSTKLLWYLCKSVATSVLIILLNFPNLTFVVLQVNNCTTWRGSQMRDGRVYI